MDVIANDNAFFIVLLIGGIIVGIHSYKLYNSSIVSMVEGDDEWMNKSLSLHLLTGMRQYRMGFICYLALSEIFYLILSSSTVILELSISVVGNAASVGALKLDSTEVNPLIPFFASSVVVAITEIRPFSLIENAIRRVAHNVAGIPRYVNSISQRVCSTIDELYETREINTKSPLSDILNNGDLISDSFSTEFTKSVDKDLQSIDRMYALAIENNNGNANFRNEQPYLDNRKLKLIEDYERLFRKLVVYGNTEWESTKEVMLSRQELASAAQDLSRQFARFIAVLVVNFDGKKKSGGEEQHLEIIAQILEGADLDPLKMNRCCLTVCAAAFVSLLTAFFYYFSFYLVPILSIESISSRDPSVLSFDYQSNELLIQGLALNQFIFEHIRQAFNAAFWDTFGLGLIFFVSTVMSLSIRTSRIEANQWIRWGNGLYPIDQYVSTAFVATLGCWLTYILFLFSKLVIVPSMSARDPVFFTVILDDFGSSYLLYTSLCLMAVPCSMAVCRINDLIDKFYHDDHEIVRKLKYSDNKLQNIEETKIRHKKIYAVRIAKEIVKYPFICGCINVAVLLWIDVLDSFMGVFQALMFPSIIIFVYIWTYTVVELHHLVNEMFCYQKPTFLDKDKRPISSASTMKSEPTDQVT